MQKKILVYSLTTAHWLWALGGVLGQGDISSSRAKLPRRWKARKSRPMNTSNFDGIGAADQTLTNATQKKSLSEAAGRKIAEENLLAYLKGQNIDARPPLKQAVTTDIKNSSGIVQNNFARRRSSARNGPTTDGCVVVMPARQEKIQRGSSLQARK